MIEDIIEKVVPGGSVVRQWALKGGMVAEMVGVEVLDGHGRVRKFAVRRHESAVYEYKVLKLLWGLGLKTAEPYYLHIPLPELAEGTVPELAEGEPVKGPIPEPVEGPLPEPVEGKAVEGPTLVMEFIEGELNFGTSDVENYVGQMARMLARIHGARIPVGDLSFLRRRAKCEELGRNRPFMGPDGKVAGLDVSGIETILAEGVPGRPNTARLLHGDFWAGNMLWRGGELVGVIDWGDAWLGDPLKDLGEARVEIVWLFGVEAAALFLETYQSAIDIDYRHLGYWDLCALLRLLRLTKGDWGWLVDFAGQHGRGDLSAEVIGEAYKRFVGQVLNS